MADKKNTPLTPEQLSQLMDGEWHDIDAASCVASACSDEQLRDDWSRWHLIRDVARGESVAAPAQSSLLASRIHDAIADEPTYSNVHSIHSGRSVAAETVASSGAHDEEAAVTRRPFAWSSAFTGAALAASVAVATVEGLDVIGSGTPSSGDSPDQLAVTDSPATSPAVQDVEFVSNSGSYWISENANGQIQRSSAENRLNMFLSEHLEHSPTAQRTGMLPYSRLIGYDQLPADADDSAEAAER